MSNTQEEVDTGKTDGARDTGAANGASDTGEANGANSVAMRALESPSYWKVSVQNTLACLSSLLSQRVCCSTISNCHNFLALRHEQLQGLKNGPRGLMKTFRKCPQQQCMSLSGHTKEPLALPGKGCPLFYF